MFLTKDLLTIFYINYYVDSKDKTIIVLVIISMLLVTSILSLPVFGIKLSREKTLEESRSLNYNVLAGENKKWNFIAYLDGDAIDSIEGDMIKHINDMEFAGSTSEVDIIVQADDYDVWGGPNTWGSTRRYYIQQDDDPNEFASYILNESVWYLDEKNMGDPQTLIDFVCWAVDNYPADRYCLTLFDHGSGWGGICYDYTNNNTCMDMMELENAMIEINNYIGKKLDILICDACNMGMIEVFYQLKEYFNIIIATEEKTSDRDISYKRILENLTAQPSINPAEFTQKIVDTCYSTPSGYPDHHFFGVYMNRIEEIKEAVNGFAQALINNMPLKFVMNIVYDYSCCWRGVQGPVYPHDLYRFSEKISDLVFDKDIQGKAQEVMSLIEDSVIRPYEGGNHYVDPHLNGIAIYVPSDKKSYNDYYEKLEFAQDTQWDEFLQKYFLKSVAKDKSDGKNKWSEHEFEIPRSNIVFNLFLLNFLGKFPNVFPILRYLLGL